MKIYLVGGAVRDKLLNRPVKEKDWVVVGGSPEEMLERGYKPVGKDFPVFIHPDTGEEYALARTERKTGKGYKGFSFHAAKDVKLEDDLQRRDLTINAIAEDLDTGTLIDPFDGKRDIKAKILRHVSEAFAEDPVRILRIARFKARFHHVGFTIADETLALMKTMVSSGEVDALVPERVWQECEKALHEKDPDIFFDVLHDCGALAKLFPEIDLKTSHNMQNTKTNIPRIQFALLCHTLSEKNIRTLIQRYRIPNVFAKLALLTARLHHDVLSYKASPDNALSLLERADAFRQGTLFSDFLHVIELLEIDSHIIAALHDAHITTKHVKLLPEEIQGKSGEEIKEILRKKRLLSLREGL